MRVLPDDLVAEDNRQKAAFFYAAEGRVDLIGG